MTYHFSAAAVAIVTVALLPIPSANGDTTVVSWSDMETTLDHSDGPLKEIGDRATQLPRFKELYESTNESVYWEMLAQSKAPLIQLTGFHFLKAHSMDSALDAAVYLALSKDFSLGLKDGVLDYISEPSNSSKVAKDLNKIAASHPDAIGLWAGLIDCLSHEELIDWFSNSLKSGMNSSYRAMIVDTIFTDEPKDTPLVLKLKEEIDGYRDIPGVPMATYILHGDEHDPGFADRLAFVLQDTNITDGPKVIVALRKRDYILHNLKWKDMKLSMQVLRAMNDSATRP